VRAALLCIAAAACVPFAETRIDGDVAPSPAVQLRERVPPPPAPPRPDAAALEALARGGTVSLAQLIDFALRTSPDTRAAWADARAAAALVGSRRSAFYPTAEIDANLARTHQVFGTTGIQFEYWSWGPSAQLSWILLDLGTRSGDVDEAKALLAAANLAHDQSVQDLVLRVEQAYTQYQGAKALLAAQKAGVSEAQTAFDAADERRKNGLATVADVLQARTALSQAQLNLQSAQGQLEVLRGAVATAVGVPATVPVETEDLPKIDLEQQLARIDDLIALAERERPDLARARAQALAAQGHAESLRWRGWPQLVFNGTANRNYYILRGAPYGDNYTGTLQLRLPLFNGFKDSYDAAQAAEQAKAAAARAESVEQQSILSVWTSYQGVRTSVQRVRTARDLLASAEESAQVAQGRYKEGVGIILDVLTAQSALAAARAQEVQARADWLLATASLAHDTGSLGPPPQGEPK
jgi:outer membrane protein